MVDLRDQFSTFDRDPELLEELRLTREPAAVLLFTPEVEAASLHWEEDPEIRAFVVCPGEACPICYMGTRPNDVWLLPVVDLEAAAIRVLRIAKQRGPGTLLGALAPFLKDEALADKVLLISRRDSYSFHVEARSMPDHADRCDARIQAHIRAVDRGLKLRGAFMQRSAAELAEVSRIARKLQYIGGYPPSPKNCQGSAEQPSADH